MEACFTHGADPEVFTDGVGRRFIQEASPEELAQLRGHLSSLSDQAISLFGHYGKDVMTQIFKSLNCKSLDSHIRTSADFRKYAEKVMEVAKLRLKYEEGVVKNGQYDASLYTSETVAAATWLIRDNFDRDLDTLIQMMRDNPSPDEQSSVIESVNGVRSLVKNSADLERIGQFVQRLSAHGFDAKRHFEGLFGKQFAKNTYKQDEQGHYIYESDDTFKTWQAILTDNKKLDEIITLCETLVERGIAPEQLMQEFGDMLFENVQTDAKWLSEANVVFSKLFERLEPANNAAGTGQGSFAVLGALWKLYKIQDLEDVEKWSETLIAIAPEIDADWKWKDLAGCIKAFGELINNEKDLVKLWKLYQRLDRDRPPEDASQTADRLKSVLGNRNPDYSSNTSEPKLLDSWRTVVAEGYSWESIAAFIETAFAAGDDDGEKLFKSLNQMPAEEKAAFMGFASAFTAKGIPPQFLVEHRGLLTEATPSKKGLAMFGTMQAQEQWLQYCADVITRNPSAIPEFAWAFTEALGHTERSSSQKRIGNIKGLARWEIGEIEEDLLDTAPEVESGLQRHAKELLNNVLQKLFQEKEFADVQLIRQHLPMAEDTIDRSVQEQYGTLLSQQSSRYGYGGGSYFDVSTVCSLRETMGIAPDHALLQDAYRKLFREYITTYHSGYGGDDDAYEEHGDKYLQELHQLAETMSVEPTFNKSFAMELYRFCLEQGQTHAQKVGVIGKETGVQLDAEFVEKQILQNPSFETSLSKEVYAISDVELDRHFARPQNTTVAEYRRVYKVFACFDYYQSVLAKLEQDTSAEGVKQRIGILGAMGLRDMENAERYQQIKERLLACGEGQGKVVGKQLAEALAELARNGDTELIASFADVLRRRSRGQVADTEKSIAGFTQEEELAYRTLSRLDNATANEALLCLLTAENVDGKVKRVTLDGLLKKGNFFPQQTREWLMKFSKYGSAFQWADLKCFQGVISIPSADLRRKSLEHFDATIDSIPHHGGIQTVHQELAPAVPDNVFMQLWKFTGGDEALLAKFNELYEKTKSMTQRDAIMFGIVNAAGVQKKVMKKVRDCLRTLDIVADPQALADLLKTISFLDTVKRRLQQGHVEDGEGEEAGGEAETGAKKPSMLAALDQPFGSVSELNQALRTVVVESIKRVLPNDAIDVDKIQTLWEQWGSLEPIFVYAGKMAGYKSTRKLLAEMVANMDPPNYAGWKEWRYNLQDSVTNEQVGHLSAEQLERWKADHFAELGDIMIATSPTDRSKQVFTILDGAIGQGHIANTDIEKGSRHQPLQERLAKIFTACTTSPDDKNRIVNEELQTIQADMKRLDAVKNHLELSKQTDCYERIKSGKGKEKDIEFVAPLLSETERNDVAGAFQRVKQEAEQAAGGKKVNFGDVLKQRFADIFNPAIQGAIARRIAESQENAVRAFSKDLCERWGIDAAQFDMNGMKSVGIVYKKLQEMKANLDLLRLSVLTPKLIATNRVSEKENKKTGETLTKVLKNLQEYFKDTPAFLQDLENIQMTVTQREELGTNRRLAMIVTDNPQILFQVGKYPIGCGSCQNYEGSPEWNKSLAGYVSDAHTNAVFLIDLQKLPKDVLQQVEEKGFDAMKDSIHPQDLLDASIARTICKLVRTESGETVLFLEPTYSSVNKGNLSMDKYFNIFSELMVSDPMGIRLVRGGGGETVRVPDSRNPNGQYEDCAAGNAGHAGMGIQKGSYTMSARFINKFSPVTQADRELAARISSGSEERSQRRAG